MDVNMNIANKQVTPHSKFLDTLFAYKQPVSHVFKDILGLYDISHFSISRIDKDCKLLTLSSTPSLEFNLFSSNLWRFDKTYLSSWYSLCSASSWQSLYCSEHYHQLYYTKQIKHRYPIGISIAVKTMDTHLIYSIASDKECPYTQELFVNQHDHFYRIGEYCSNALLPLISTSAFI